MIQVHNLLPMLVDATDADILAIESHLRTHPNRTSPAPDAVSIGGPFTDEERAETQAKLEELQAMPARIAELEADIEKLGATVDAQANELLDALAKLEAAQQRLADTGMSEGQGGDNGS